MKISPSKGLVAVAVGGILGVSLGVVAATAGDDGTPEFHANPVEREVQGLEGDGSHLVETHGGSVCIITRLGRASGSACAAPDASDVLVSETMSLDGVTISVYDPTQEVHHLQVDGVRVERQESSRRGFFSVTLDRLPEHLSVKDGMGEIIAEFTPAANDRRNPSDDPVAESH